MSEDPRYPSAQPGTDPHNTPVAQPEVAPAVPSQATQAAQVAATQTDASQAYAQAYAQQYAYSQPYAQQYGYTYQQPAYAAPVGETQKKKRNPMWYAAAIALVLLVVFMGISMVTCSMSVVAPLTADDSMGVITTGDTVAVINMEGTIDYDGSECSPEGMRDLIAQAEENPDIKAIVLRVNSGGGSASAGEEMADYIKNCSKPIVVSSAAINASAAYEISSQADYIYVNKSTEIGAIGTILQMSDISELLDKLGIKVENIASAESKDSSYGTRPLSDEEREYYQYLVDTINKYFIEAVADGRDMTLDEVRALATGLIYTGTDAVENGLADEVGTYDDALDKAAELGGIYGTYDVIPLYVATYDLDGLLGLLGAESGDMTVNELIDTLNMKGTIE